MTNQERAFILGSLIGDAIGFPAHKKPHHIVRMYFKGIKGYTDEYFSTATPTGLRKGQNSKEILPILQQLPNENVIDFWTDQFFGIAETHRLKNLFRLLGEKESLEPIRLDDEILGASKAKILESLSLFPTDLVSIFNEAMTESDAVNFAISMLLRNPADFETAVLSTVNMGGLTALSGAIVGGGIGLMNGLEQIPKEWIEGLERSSEILSRLAA
jgi:ADP-ribosylglycohydrolase